MEVQEYPSHLIVNGEKFAKLSPNDRARLLAPVKAERRRLFKQELKEGGITGQEYVNELDAFDQQVFGDQEWYGLLSSIEGRAAIFAAAAKKSAPDDAACARILDTLALDIDDDFALAAKLSGVKLISKAEKAAADEGIIKRQAFKLDLQHAGFVKDEFLERLAKYDAEHEIPEARPSAAGS